jgi:hypothetical protein
MEAREPEPKATIAIATKARRVGSVLISKSNFIGQRKVEGTAMVIDGSRADM